MIGSLVNVSAQAYVYDDNYHSIRFNAKNPCISKLLSRDTMGILLGEMTDNTRHRTKWLHVLLSNGMICWTFNKNVSVIS